jgi:hypothetical protein
MKKEEMIKELDETLGKANVKLVNICGDKRNIEDVVLTVEHGADAEILRSGMNIVETIPNADVFGALKKTKRAMWAVVDRTRDEVCGKTEKPEKPEKHEKAEKAEKGETGHSEKEKKGKFDGKPLKGMAFDDLMGKINDLLISANSKLEEMVKASGNFPYSMNDIIMTVDSDEAGIYLYSGRTPVCAVVRAGSKEGLFRDIKSAVWAEVDATRSAIERRKALKEEAKALAEESEKRDKAAAALKAAGLDAVTGKCVMFANGKNVIIDGDRSFMKVIAEKGTHRILGAEFMCERASDMISEMSEAIDKQLTVEDLLQVMRPHPSFEESLTDALLDTLKKLDPQ